MCIWIFTITYNRGKGIINTSIQPFLMLIVMSYIIEMLEKNSSQNRFLLFVSNYSFGIYLYAEPLNYLILYLIWSIDSSR